MADLVKSQEEQARGGKGFVKSTKYADVIKDYENLREKWANEEAAKKAFGRTIDKLNEQAKDDSTKLV